MEADFHLTNKAVFIILSNKTACENIFVPVTRKKVSKV